MAAVLVLALLIGEIVDQVVKASTPASKRASSSWVAAVAPLVGQSTSLASTLRQLRNLTGLPSCSAAGCTRTSFDTMLGELVTGTASDVRQLGAIGLEPSSPRSGSLLGKVMSDRQLAANQLAGAVALLLGPSRSHATLARAQGLLLGAGSELTSADSTYRRFVGSIPANLRTPKLGKSVWVSDPASWTRSGVQGWADRLVGSAGLRSTASIALLAVSTSPPVLRISGLPASITTTTVAPTTTTSTTTTTTTRPPGSSSTTSTTTTSTTTTTTVPPTTTTLQVPPAGSVSVIQPTSNLTVQVVVADAGNLRASAVTVVAELTERSGASAATRTASSVTDHVGALEPGVARYLSLRPMPVAKGGTYLLTVTATVPGWRSAVERVTIRVAP